MDLGIISARYAKALLRFAVENKEEDSVYAEMSMLAKAFKLVPALQQALLNPALNGEDKLRILLSAAQTDALLTQSTRAFMGMVVKRQRADVMLFISHSYAERYRKMKHIIEAHVVVPTAVNDDVVKHLQKLVEEKTQAKVVFQVTQDDSIGGGFILEYDTYRLDASVRAQLNTFRRELVK